MSRVISVVCLFVGLALVFSATSAAYKGDWTTVAISSIWAILNFVAGINLKLSELLALHAPHHDGSKP